MSARGGLAGLTARPKGSRLKLMLSVGVEVAIFRRCYSGLGLKQGEEQKEALRCSHRDDRG